MFLTEIVKGQFLSIEAKSGLAFVSHTRQNYTSGIPAHVPLNLSLGLGSRHFQVGGDIIVSARPQTFIFYDDFTDDKRIKEVAKESYYGAFVRFNSARHPDKNASLILKVGIGVLNSTKLTYILPSDVKYSEADYEPATQYLLECGFKVPIIKRKTFLYFGYGFNRVRKELLFDDIKLESFTQTNSMFQLGLNVNFNLRGQSSF